MTDARRTEYGGAEADEPGVAVGEAAGEAEGLEVGFAVPLAGYRYTPGAISE